MSAERNLGMEQVSRLLNFPCRYHPMGCKVAAPLNKKEQTMKLLDSIFLTIFMDNVGSTKKETEVEYQPGNRLVAWFPAYLFPNLLKFIVEVEIGPSSINFFPDIGYTSITKSIIERLSHYYRYFVSIAFSQCAWVFWGSFLLTLLMHTALASVQFFIMQ
jgi:hypothetical protein